VNPLVVGIGAASRGDDGIGFEVARAVGAMRLSGVDVVEAAEPIRLVDLVLGRPLVVIVDAMVTGAAPGDVVVFDALPAAGFGPSSTHSLSVGQALGLARVLGRMPHSLSLVGVEIAEDRLGVGISAAVRAAVPRAAAEVRRLLFAVPG
jgi:hydrogenase maturation protease